MAAIIDYPLVLQRLQSEDFENLYHNAGAFGFPAGAAPRVLAWIGADDPTIRDAARAFVRQIPPPYESTLASLFRRAWIEHLPGPLWVMPMSHWHYELQFGNGAWLAGAVEALGLDPQLLRQRNNGAAIELPMGDWPQAESFIEDLLRHLAGSDFLAAFPGKAALCTIHHHKQLWWQTTDPATANSLDQLARPSAP